MATGEEGGLTAGQAAAATVRGAATAQGDVHRRRQWLDDGRSLTAKGRRHRRGGTLSGVWGRGSDEEKGLVRAEGRHGGWRGSTMGAALTTRRPRRRYPQWPQRSRQGRWRNGRTATASGGRQTSTRPEVGMTRTTGGGGMVRPRRRHAAAARGSQRGDGRHDGAVTMPTAAERRPHRRRGGDGDRVWRRRGGGGANGGGDAKSCARHRR